MKQLKYNICLSKRLARPIGKVTHGGLIVDSIDEDDNFLGGNYLLEVLALQPDNILFDLNFSILKLEIHLHGPIIIPLGLDNIPLHIVSLAIRFAKELRQFHQPPINIIGHNDILNQNIHFLLFRL